MDIFKKLERIRKELLVLSLLAFLLAVLGFLALALIPSAAAGILFSLLAWLSFLLTLGMIRLRVSAYKRLYGQHMMAQILSTEFEKVTYDPKGALEEDLVASTDTIMMGNTFLSAEKRSGEYRSVKMTMADVALKNLLGRTSVTYFDGTWMVFTFPKAFRRSLEIKEKSFLNAQKPQGENPELDRVMVGSEELARFFKIYGESEALARDFLSKSLEEAVITLNYELPGDLMLYFHKDRLHIACHGRRLQYEPPLLGKLHREEIEQVLLSDCRTVKRFLDTVLSDTSLFLD